MKENMSKADLVRLILGEVADNTVDEEVIHLLVEHKVSQNINLKRDTFGQIAADRLAAFAGSWTFVIIFTAVLILWMLINLYFLVYPFDPFPFILLNLVLSSVAAIQAPLIMMSQNRQEEKDRLRAENDYKINLKTELIIEDLHNKMDAMIENQKEILKKIGDDNHSFKLSK